MPVINPAYWLLAIMITAGASGWWGYHQGHQSGALEVRAVVDSQAVANLTDLIDSQTRLIEQANQAGRALRAATATRARNDEKTTQELLDVLAKTAALRADCQFAADVMRQLQAARDRAAQAAAAGLDEPVPGASAGADE